ncbi:unnamed protein product [Mytilus coruscus]|uniref:Uncharacterized protein n=1 Tax=Mytilus coruscus TaxID=42192 RepID=A0A6J8C4T5_MYTCO|nr:unnamed protein product [Mytilus coruscus]
MMIIWTYNFFLGCNTTTTSEIYSVACSDISEDEGFSNSKFTQSDDELLINVSKIDSKSHQPSTKRFHEPKTDKEIEDMQSKKKKAQLETKVKYSAKQANLIRQKAALEAELSILQIKEETELLESEIRILENESTVGEDDDLDSVSEVQKERTKEYVQNLHIPVTKPIAIVNTPEQQSAQLTNAPTPYVPPDVDNNNSQIELGNLITKMMARKDIVLSRLVKYNDSSFQFLS